MTTEQKEKPFVLTEELGKLIDDTNALLFQLHREYSELVGEPTLGYPGRQGYSTADEVESFFLRRKEQIKRLKEKIREAKLMSSENPVLTRLVLLGQEIVNKKD